MPCVETAWLRLSRHRINGKGYSAPMPAEWRGGTHIPKECSEKHTTRLLAGIVGNSLKAMATAIGCSVPVTAICDSAERRPTMSDYDTRLFAFQTAMALARSMRSKGLISAKEYAKIDTIIAEKYGISSCSICTIITNAAEQSDGRAATKKQSARTGLNVLLFA